MMHTESTQHLTAEQMDALLFAESRVGDGQAAMHLETCKTCAAELNELRMSLVMFREASTGFAERQRPRTNLIADQRTFRRGGFRGIPAYFALAASLAVAAVILPLVRPLPKPRLADDPPPVRHSTAPDDEALLMEIDQQLDASVPAVMEPLADPTTSHRRHATPETADTKED